MAKKQWNKIRALFTFTDRERKGILWLLPLLAVIAAVLVLAGRPAFEESFLEQVSTDAGLQPGARDYDGGDAAGDSPEAELFRFDPNRVTLQELVRLGFPTRTAAGIIKYRESGKRFEIPEDFATCYGVSIEDFSRLEPYIVIGEEFRLRPRQDGGTGLRADRETMGQVVKMEELSPFDPNDLDEAGFVSLGFTQRQAEVIIRYRDAAGGFGSSDDFARCYVVSEDMMERLSQYIEIKSVNNRPATVLVDINSADTAQLRTVRGVGAVLAGRIVDYRERLGGYASVNQLAEIPGMTEANFERIVPQIFADSCEIQKIDVNFASHKTLAEQLGNHPYIKQGVLRKLLSARQMKGGWSTIGDMVNENIFTEREAEKLAPYLVFRPAEQ